MSTSVTVFIENVLIFLHLVGMAIIVGSFLYQLPAAQKVINTGMWHGILTQLVTGVALIGVAQALHGQDPATYELPNNTKYGIKLLVAVVLAVIIFRGKGKPAEKNVYFAVGGLALADVAVAVFWI